ncbi:hypothetical protein LBMAG47_00400 [Planctomycetia bacterium]|nr:hypothetical protein LBMAG47_00400 [Planctomycetia bacterium]
MPFRLAAIAAMLVSVPLHAAEPAPLKPIRVILVGDSTVTDTAGWGTGLATLVRPEATVVNHARGGASTSATPPPGSAPRYPPATG